MKRLFSILVLMALLMVPASMCAQEKVEATVGADVVSKYIWRGQDCGEGAVQPSASISYAGLSLSAWGSYGFVDTDDAKEFDLTLAYSIGGFTVGITDYFIAGDDAQYFKYEAHETAHVFEANVGYDFGPVALNWYTVFAGADGLNSDGDRAYSSYFEISAPFKLGGLEWGAAIGCVPYATSFYADVDGFAVTNVTLSAAKDIQITEKFALPLFASITANPATSKMYFTCGLSF